MWLQKWIWERYKELRLRIGINTVFTFKKAKEILSYDSNQTIYKLLNELEKFNIIKVERLKKDRREKKYKIVLDLKDIPYSYINIPSNYKPRHEFLASTESMAIQGAITVKSPSREFNKIYNKESNQFVTIVPEKEAQTIEEYLTKLIKEYKAPEAILSIIKKHRIDFNKIISNLNSYQKRYLGALLEILNKYKEVKGRLYELTKNDKRMFSIFPKVKKIPKEYKKTAKRWRINLNIDVVNLDEL